MRRSRPRLVDAQPDGRRPPPSLGSGPRRLPVADRRARRDPAAVRPGGSRAAPGAGRHRSDDPRPDPIQPRRDQGIPGDRRGQRLHRRGRRLGGPGRSGRRRGDRRAASTAAAGRGWSGSATRSRTSPIRRGSSGPTSIAGSRRSAPPGWSTTCSSVPGRCRPRSKPSGPTPDVAFVIDHLGKPPIRSGELEPWLSLMRPFGELDNVACKVSGLVTEADWRGWQVDDLRPFVDRALEIFGPERLLFGSDWPVCLLAATYQEVVDAARSATAHSSGDEREQVFGETARRVYRLAPRLTATPGVPGPSGRSGRRSVPRRCAADRPAAERAGGGRPGASPPARRSREP